MAASSSTATSTLSRATAVATLLSRAISSKATNKITISILNRTSALLAAQTHSVHLKQAASSTAFKVRLTASTMPATLKATPRTMEANRVSKVATDKTPLHKTKHISNSNRWVKVDSKGSSILRQHLNPQILKPQITTLMPHP